MPNWCENLLKVAGEKKEAERFLNDGVADEKWAISHYIPTPKELLENGSRDENVLAELRRKYGHDHWYEWRLANYGCKWDCEAEYEMVRWDDGTLLIEFDSPWSPPVEFLRHVQRMYPKLDFELLYMELGCFFAGCAETERDEEGNPYIVDEYGEPYYEDEDGNVIDYNAEGFDWEEFEKEHTAVARNPFEK
ncbi:MAG: hypothetical protein MJZ57_06620 [Bacteroidales bacterium]|nr:hypothetical protein [Bacteroidales bacterium]